VDIFIEVSPQIKPSFREMHNGTFEMLVPGSWIKVATHCSQDIGGYRPCEEFSLALPEVQRVIFDPWANLPPNGRAWCQARKLGLVLDLPSHVTANTKLKTDSPFGSLIVEGSSTVLNYRLQVDGQLGLYRNAGNMGAHRLELELDFTFDCYVGGPAVAELNQSQAISKTIEGFAFRDGPPSVSVHTRMNKSSSEGCFS
jgi:hypothetical protein